MTFKSIVSIVLITIFVVVSYLSLYVVKETEKAIKLQFGQIVEADIQPGIHMKIPFFQTVKRYDGRILTLDAKAERFLTAGKKYVIVDAFVKWKIKDVFLYYKSTSGILSVAKDHLARLSNEGLKNEFGTRSLFDVVSGERDQLMATLTDRLNKQALKDFGVEIIDVRVKAIDLPKILSQDVYRSMQAEREREASELKSEGKELAEGIKAEADRNKTILLAEAYSQSEKIKGEGDAISAATYAKAYDQDAEFYAFTRSLKAYTQTFTAGDTLVLKPDSDFFKYLNNQQGK
jgi:membrane protease subunit HflC